MKKSSAITKSVVVAVSLHLASCQAWGPLDNPTDPKSAQYQGYDTVTNPDAIAAALPADKGTLSGTSLTAAKVVGATAYELRIAASTAALDSTPLFSKADYGSNVMDISASGIQDKTSYWWKVRATVGGKVGAWSASPSFTTSFQPAATPTFSPAGGTYSSDQSVSINSATTGASIYYTTDGSAPTTASTKYTAPITAMVNPSMTIKAIATASLFSQSAVGTATYSQPSILTMLSVAGGSFNNGTSDVSVSSFLMSKYELTQGQYQSVTANNPSSFTGDTNRPVEQVTWYDAVEFCNKLSTAEGLTPVYAITSATVTADMTKNGYRLPTEAEWEFAARGGNLTHGYTYAGSNMVDTVAWYSSNSGSTTHTVGTKAANELGLYDMSGNVWEWCWDWFGTIPSGNQIDPTGPTIGTYRALHGGSWGNLAYAVNGRDRDDPSSTHSSVVGVFGFRPVRNDPAAARIPTGLTATAGSGQVSLSWTASTNATSYCAYYKLSSATSFTAVPASMVSGTTATITGLTGGSSYDFAVTALNGAVESPKSLVATATPTAATTSGVPRNGLVAEYLFSGNANDTSGNGYNGTMTGLNAEVDRFGTSGYCYQYDSYTDTIVLPSNAPIDNQVMSFVAWVKIAPATTCGLIYAKANDTGLPVDFFSVANPGIYIDFCNGASRKTISANNSFFDNFWHMVGFTRTATTVSLILDGAIIHTEAYSGYNVLPNAALELGNYNQNNYSDRGFRGSLDDVRIYNRSLTTAEVTAIYTEGGWTGNPLLTMLSVAGGSFNNGTSDVTVSSFLISKYELTQGQYQSVTANNPSSFTGDTNRPVEQVTWYDAVEFCNKLSTAEGLTPVYSISARSPATGYPITSATVAADWTKNGYRLPTEAEWEFTARGGNLTHGYAYAGANTIDTVAWYSSNSGSTTHAVGTKAANELGLYDMSGNVWEWCWDRHGNYPNSDQVDPLGAATGTVHLIRSGSWANPTSLCVVTYRDNNAASNGLGFRPVRNDPAAARIPTGLAATAGAGQASLSWTASANATSYCAYYKLGSATSFTAAPASMVSGTSATITGLTGGSSYDFAVTALNGTVESPKSLVATATPTAASTSGVPRNGIVAEYLFSGNANDTAGTNNGTVNGATLMGDRFGNAGKAYSFNGTDNWIDKETLDSASYRSFSYSVWAKPTSTIGTGSYLIGTRNGYCGLYNTNGFYIDTPDNRDGAAPNRSYDKPTGGFTFNNWQHFVFVVDGTGIEAYKDSVLVGSGATWIGNNSGIYAKAIIGAIMDTRPTEMRRAGFFNGCLDDLRIYNRALTSAEVTALFTEGGWTGPPTTGSAAISLSGGLLGEYNVTFTPTATTVIAAPDTSGTYPIYVIPRSSLPLIISASSSPAATTHSWVLDGVTQSSTGSSLTLTSATLSARKHSLALFLSKGTDPKRSATIILDATN